MRIWNNRRAVSGSISAMFVVLLFLLVASSLLSFRFAEDRYNSMVNDRAQRDWERYNERLVIPSALRKGTGTSATLDASIQNVGAVSAHLVTLFLSAYDAGKNPRWQLQYSISIWMGQGNTTYHFGQNKSGPPAYILIRPDQTSQPKSTVALPDDPLTYVVKVVTERGNIVIETIGETQTQLPQLVMVPGTMEINHIIFPYSIPYVFTGWKRPYVSHLDLHNSLDAGLFYVRATFVNNWGEAITITQGSILFQVCMSGKNQKIFGFGGSIYSEPQTWTPRQQVEVVFSCTSWSGWLNAGQLSSGIFPTGVIRVPWVGSAGFTSNQPDSGQTFYSGAVLIDGLLVYKG